MIYTINRHIKSMDNISIIAEQLRKGELISNPHQCAENLQLLAGEYAWIMSQLELILQKKPVVWNELRRDAKSDTSAERMWESTVDGLNEAGLRLREKSVGKMMSTLRTLIQLAENESKNVL